MKIDILTIFPDMFDGPFDQSLLKKAQENKVLEHTNPRFAPLVSWINAKPWMSDPLWWRTGNDYDG
jgi:hypothetical protein